MASHNRPLMVSETKFMAKVVKVLAMVLRLMASEVRPTAYTTNMKPRKTAEEAAAVVAAVAVALLTMIVGTAVKDLSPVDLSEIRRIQV